MQVDDIRRLVKLVEESNIDELEIRRWWEVIRITKRARVQPGEAPRAAVAAAAPAAAVPAVVAPAPSAPATPVAAPAPREGDGSAPATAPAGARPGSGADDGLVAVRSPMVGTFYRAPNPTAPPFVDAGSRVVLGQVVCIVEAMKLMNEIEAEVGGVVEKVMVENGKPVEYNQPLFLVRPD
jgi:acetyl-CoA carboxylase biotin carboxyl carrier protein